jgi:hypothetical protein
LHCIFNRREKEKRKGRESESRGIKSLIKMFLLLTVSVIVEEM